MALTMSETYGDIPRTAPPAYAVATATRPQHDADFVGHVTTWIPDRPTTQKAHSRRLEKPIVIPRLDINGRLATPLPFMRAYSPALRPHDIDEREFVAFIDNLTVAQAPPAPLQVLNVAGSAVGFVPHHWAMAAGSSMNIAAGVGTAAVSYGRTRYFLEKVNREYFAPRGLRVSLCKHPQLLEKLALNTDTTVLADKNLQHGIISIRDRCMYALQPYVADLSFNVPPPSGERNILDKIAAKGIERKRKKQEEKSRKNDGYSSDSSSSSSSSSDSDSEDDKSQRKIARRVRKINREAKKDLRKHPDRAAQIEENRAEKVFQVENKPSRDSGKRERKKNKKESKRLEKSNKRQSKDLEKVRKLEFIIVEDMSKQHSTT